MITTERYIDKNHWQFGTKTTYSDRDQGYKTIKAKLTNPRTMDKIISEINKTRFTAGKVTVDEIYEGLVDFADEYANDTEFIICGRYGRKPRSYKYSAEMIVIRFKKVRGKQFRVLSWNREYWYNNKFVEVVKPGTPNYTMRKEIYNTYGIEVKL